ncbi:MAG TPA: protein kinase [Planctomycetota bacterium]
MAEELPSTPFERTLRAYDRVLQRQVLLKLPGAGAWDGWSTPVRERMLREARALAKARHDGIEPIHWVDVTPEGPLLVLDLPEGEPLESRLAAGPLGVEQTRELGIQLAEALSAVHYHGIVHRAISVASVRLLADDRVRLGTFTFAKGFEARPMQSSIDHKRRTEPAIAPYLPPYVAPEQLAGQGANPRTDVFALGCLLYRCLTGTDPSPFTSDVSPLSDLRTKRSDVPKAFHEVLRRCTHLAATARYPSAQAAAEALRATRPVANAGAPFSRRALLAVLVASALTLGGVGYSLGGSRGGGGGGGGDGGDPPVETRIATDEKFSDGYNKCHALLIGIASGYSGSTHPVLKNPVNEVKAVRQKLIDNDPARWNWGSEAIRPLVEREADKLGIEKELCRLEREDVVGREDGVLLYFTGHGVKDLNQYFLVAAGSTGDNPNIHEGYVPQLRIANFLDKCPAKHVLVVLDCCHSGPMFSPTKGRPGLRQGDSRLAGQFLRSRARHIIGSAGEEAADGLGLSPFCRAFLKALTPKKEGPAMDFVYADLLHNCIGAEMGMSTAGASVQVPTFTRRPPGQGSFVFFFLPK